MITCIGSINVDFIFASDRWPAEHEKYRSRDYVCVGGGSAANTAAELTRLGCKVRIVGGIGNDDLGNIALNSLTRAGVNTDHVVRRNEWKTGCAAVRSSGTTKSILTAGLIEAAIVLDSLQALDVQKGDHLHFSWAPPPRLQHQLREWRRSGISLSWETNGRMDMPTAELVDIVFMNKDERLTYEHERALTDAWIRSSSHTVTAVVTLGSAGAEAYFRGQRYFRSANEVNVVDRTGGGDAFDAGFIAAWLDRRALDVCLACGLQSAAIIIRQLGSQYRGKA